MRTLVVMTVGLTFGGVLMMRVESADPVAHHSGALSLRWRRTTTGELAVLKGDTNEHARIYSGNRSRQSRLGLPRG